MGYFCFAPRGGLREKWYLDPPSRKEPSSLPLFAGWKNIPIFISFHPTLRQHSSSSNRHNVLFCTLDTPSSFSLALLAAISV